MGGGPLAEPGEAVRRVGGLPAAPVGQPARGVKWWKVTTGSMPRSRQAAATRR